MIEKDYPLPPCMRNVVRDIREGKNPTHFARFGLVSYLLRIGVPAEDCKSLFETVYDYDPPTTSYQVDSIRDGDYSPPTCEKFAENGLCPVAQGTSHDMLCEKPWLTHPLKWWRCRK